MTPIADMVEKMTADGVPVATILLAIRTAEQVSGSGNSTGIPVDTTAEKRRAYDRERKRNKANSTGNSTGIPPDSENALSSKEDFLNKKEKKEEAKPKRSTGKSLPDDWSPSEGHFAEAAKLGKSRVEVEAKADAMRIWAKTNSHRATARKTDWGLTFTGWMRRDWGAPPAESAPQANGGWRPGLPTEAELREKYAKDREDQTRLSGHQKPEDAGVFREGGEVHPERRNGIHDPAGHAGMGCLDAVLRPTHWGNAVCGTGRDLEGRDDERGTQGGSNGSDAISRMV